MSTLMSLPTGPLTRARTNLSIVERLAELEAGTPTADDLELFTHWSGWGPMAKAFEPAQPDQSWADIGTQLAVLLDAETTAFARAATTTAYFTTRPIIDAMWRLAVDLGTTEGAKVFEPGCGSGRFLGAAPFPIEAVGVEADPITARIAQYLNPDATIVNRQIQETTLADEAFDLVIGNVPFSETTPTDRARGGQSHRLSLHNYCLWRGLHALRPGGYLVAITSRYTLDAEHLNQRAKLAELGEFIGAIRLPKGTFHDAGTDVIADIVVMRRRAVPTEHPEAEPEADWLHTDPLNNSWGAPPMNRVLHKHRYWIAGEPGVGRGQYSNNELTVTAGSDTDARINRASEQIAAAAAALPPIEITGTFAPVLVQPDVENRKVGSFHFVNDDGTVVQIVPNDQGIAVPVPVKANKELCRLIVLRNAVLDLLNLEADPNTSDDALFLPRLILNKVYDDYIAHHDGAINRCTIYDRGIDPDTGIMRKSRRRPTMGGFRQDPDYVTVLSIEEYDDDTQTASKGPIFTRRVNRPQLDVTSVATGGEAVAVSMNRHGRIDRDLIAELLGITPDEVPDAISGHAYLDPQLQAWVPADEYLSGNVRQKLEIAKFAVVNDPRLYHENVAKLTAIQPRDLMSHEIAVRLGAPWVPARVVRDFVIDLLEPSYPDSTAVTRERVTATWTVDCPYGRTSKWGTTRVEAARLIELALNNETPVVYDRQRGADGKDHDVRNDAETLMACEKQAELQERFGQWVWEDTSREAELVELYNVRYNSTVLRSFSGEHLSWPSMAAGFEPYQHQKDMVARALGTQATACGHPVGAGKTAIMGMTAIKLRETGLTSKPCAVVPNHLVEQVSREIKALFPTKRILVVDKDDMKKERRKLFAAKAATGDWDLIVMTHSAFTMLPVDPATEREYVNEKIARYSEALNGIQSAGGHGYSTSRGGARTVKRIEKALEKLREKSRELLFKQTDDGVTFGQLGVSYLLLDEAHYFKNLSFATRSRGGPPASKRAEDLALKLWALRRIAADMPGHHNHVAMLLSGTLVSNTLAEMFVMQTYLQPERLEELEIEHFDAWAGLFVQNVTKIEVAPDGGSFRMQTRAAKFRNVPELRRMFGEVSDIRTKQQLGLPGPNVNFNTIVIPPTPELTSYVDNLVQRADDVRSKRVHPTDDNMLKVCTDGRKAALDLELVGVWATDPGKIGPVVDQLLAQWDPDAVYLGPDGNLSPTTGNLQVAFCDLGTPNSESTQVYGKIRAELIDRGMPADKIRFIHEAKTDAAKAVLFSECRTGKVAVLLGSTDKLGVGTNIQHRMTDLHHIDAPWRPADVEQREGRGDRPGNQNATLNVWRYVRERSFDAYMWQGLERKAAFIAQVLTGDLNVREVEDIDSSTTLSFAEVKALATGNPLVMEQAEAAAEVARMKRLAEGHGQLQSRLRSDISTSQHWSDSYNRQAAEYEKLLAALGDQPGWRESRFGSTTVDLAEIGEAIGVKAVSQFSKSGMVSTPCGWVGGVELTLWTHEPKLLLGARKAQIHAKINGEDIELLTIKLDWLRRGRFHRIGEELAQRLAPEGIDEKVSDARARAVEEDVRRDRLAGQLTPFDKQPELDAAIARLDTILEAMADDMKAASAAPAPTP